MALKALEANFASFHTHTHIIAEMKNISKVIKHGTYF